MTTIKLNQKLQRLEVKSFEIENEIIFNYFNNLPMNIRDEKFLRAIYIGVLALMEDRLSSFLSKTSNELGTELESLKMIFDMKQELFYKSNIKGVVAEVEVAQFLNAFFKEKKLKDIAILTGSSTGVISNNKTGDIVCDVNGSSAIKIAIECKFDKSVKLGPIDSKNIFIRKTDTAWSQLLEAQANREGRVSLIVFDRSLVDNSILKITDNVGYIPEIGFVSIIDSQKGDYSNLVIAYMLARDIALNAKEVELEKDTLSFILTRILKDIQEVRSIKTLVEKNIENNKDILKQLEKSMQLMEFNQLYLTKFLENGTLTKKDMLDFYMGEDVKGKFKLIEKEIDKI